MYTFEKYLLVVLFLGTTLAINPFFNTDVFEFPKLMALIVVVGVLTLVNLWDRERWGNLKKFPKEFLFLAVFLVANIISFSLSEDKAVSLLGKDMRFQGFLTQIHYVLLSFNCAFFFIKYPREKTQSLFYWLIACLLMVCFWAVSPYFLEVYIFHPLLYGNRVFGTLGNPNYLASFIIVVLPFYVLAFNSKVKWRIPFFALGLILVLVTLFLTGTRSAWIASIIGFLFIGILKLLKSRSWKVLFITSGIILLMMGGVIFQTKFAEKEGVFRRLSVESESLTSLKTRMYLWESGFNLFLEKPIFGFGQDTIQNNIDPYLPDYLKANDVFFIDRTHSELIDIAVMLGLFGLLSYIGFFLMIFVKSIHYYFKNYSFEGSPPFEAALTALFSLHLFNMVNFSTITTSVLLYFFSVYLSLRIRSSTTTSK